MAIDYNLGAGVYQLPKIAMFATETQNVWNENVFCVFRDSVAISLSQVRVSINYLKLKCLPRKHRMLGMRISLCLA